MMPAIGAPVAANTSLGASLILLPCLRCLLRATNWTCTDYILRYIDTERAIRLDTKLLLRSIALLRSDQR